MTVFKCRRCVLSLFHYVCNGCRRMRQRPLCGCSNRRGYCDGHRWQTVVWPTNRHCVGRSVIHFFWSQSQDELCWRRSVLLVTAPRPPGQRAPDDRWWGQGEWCTHRILLARVLPKDRETDGGARLTAEMMLCWTLCLVPGLINSLSRWRCTCSYQRNQSGF